MNLPVKVFNIKLVRRCANVSLFIPISSEKSVNMSDQQVVSNIELSSLVQKWSIDIKLNYEGLLNTILMLPLSFNDLVQLICLINNCDSVPSVG